MGGAVFHRESRVADGIVDEVTSLTILVRAKIRDLSPLRESTPAR